MKITALMGCLDEESLIEAAVTLLFSSGISSLVITDLGSTDGSIEIIRRLQKQYEIALLKGDPCLEVIDWGIEMQKFALAEYSPDYLMYIDPDEMFFAPNHDFVHFLQGCDADVIKIPRFNAVPYVGMNIDYSSKDKLLDMFVYREKVRLSPDHPLNSSLLEHTIAPKVLFKACNALFLPGFHDVRHETLKKSITTTELAYLHLPITDFSRFERKVKNIHKNILKNPSYFKGNTGWQWQRWAKILEDGNLQSEFNSQLVEKDALEIQFKNEKIGRMRQVFQSVDS
ncbi:glycosyltransferase family 2 protein [Colwelliaceae bacterium 6441]